MGDADDDPMLGGRQSSVLQTLKAARESLRGLQRPVTPSNARSLFAIDQYGGERPSSAHNRSVYLSEGSKRLKPRLKPLRPLVSRSIVNDAPARGGAAGGGDPRPKTASARPAEGGKRIAPRRPSSARGVRSRGRSDRWLVQEPQGRMAPRPDARPTSAAGSASVQVLSLGGAPHSPVGPPPPPPTVLSEEDERFNAWRESVEAVLLRIAEMRPSQIEGLLAECDSLHSLVDRGMGHMEWNGWIARESTVLLSESGSSITVMEAILRATMHVMNRETVLEPEVTLFLRTACINLKLCAGNFTLFALKPSLQSLFYLSKKPQNDVAFRRERVIQPLLSYLRRILDRGVESCPVEVLVYVTGILKNIGNDEGNQTAFIRAGAPATFFSLLSAVCESNAGGGGGEGGGPTKSKDLAQMCVQITSLLRMMIDAGPVLKLFYEDMLHTILAKLLLIYVNHQELVFNVTRIFSKLAAKDEWSEFIGEDALCLRALMEVLKLYQLHYDVLVRALFAMGSITMYCESALDMLFSSLEAETVVLQVLSTYVKKIQSGSSPNRDYTKLVRKLGRNEEELDSAMTIAELNEPFTPDIVNDVLSKLLSIIANLSLHPDNGFVFAGNERLSKDLQFLICSSSVHRDEELLLNVISVLANLSYYRGDGQNHILGMSEDIVTHVAQYLFSENAEIVEQSARVFGNFSRIRETRALMHKEFMIEKLAYLLSHKSLNVACSATGPIVNLLTDANEGTALFAHQIESKLIDVLERIVHSHDYEAVKYTSATCMALFNARHAQECYKVSHAEENTQRFGGLKESLLELKSFLGESWKIVENLIELMGGTT